MSKYANENFNEQLLASSFLAENDIRVLKHNETFGIFDRYGDITKRAEGEQGLYHAGTRFLSKFELLVDGKKPLLLSSFITEDNAALTVDLTNPNFGEDQNRVPNGAVHIKRSIFLWNNCRNELINFFNYIDHDITLNLQYRFEADYNDIFEVRGHTRARRGTQLPPNIKDGRLTFTYHGLDDIIRETTINSTPQATMIDSNSLSLSLTIPAKGTAKCELKCIIGLPGLEKTSSLAFADSYLHSKEEALANRQQDALITTSNEQFNDLINRSLADIHLLITSTPCGPYPYAGVPWFSAPFGRDGVLSALEMLWINPDIAKAVLHFLASTQGVELDADNDCEPGKIIHEARQGEMANLGEIPFKRYYGSVDSTPLFVLLAGAYYKRTADHEFIRSIWPNIKAALRWIDEYGDKDGDGFVEYARYSSNGLVHQGWKDSDNSIFHTNGDLAAAPIALCEVQGYVYLAFKRAAYLARVMDEEEYALQLMRKARILKDAFNEAFWGDDIGSFALALDKDKARCLVRSSNAGHCLFTGIADDDYARRVADLLMSPEMFSGWGVRTIGENEALYNPMSYHNGTIWPHDNALVGSGLARYGFKDSCLKILTGLFDASNVMDFHRLPELFCGFSRSPGRNPTIYPMSCAPQAWAAGSIFLLLDACLGIKIKATTGEVISFHPKLPDYLNSVTVRNLKVGTKATVDMEFVNHGADVGVNLLKRNGDIKVIVVK